MQTARNPGRRDRRKRRRTVIPAPSVTGKVDISAAFGAQTGVDITTVTHPAADGEDTVEERRRRSAARATRAAAAAVAATATLARGQN